MRILAVDDNHQILDDYKMVLQEGPPEETSNSFEDLEQQLFGPNSEELSKPVYDLSLCNQGKEAVELVRQSIEEEDPFCLVFLDMRMPPGMDGLSTAEQIRKLDDNIHIVIVTAFSDVSPDEIISRLGSPDKVFYIQKPFNVHEIKQFANALTAKWQSDNMLGDLYQDMEDLVVERTAEVMTVNRKLRSEVENRKCIENEIRESEERFRLLQEASFSGIIIHDHGVILDTNLETTRLTGYTQDELIGKEALFLIHPDSRESTWEKVSSNWEMPYESTGLRKDGSTFPIEIQAKEIPYKGRQVRVAEFKDITKRLKMTKELQENDNYIREVFDSIHAGVIVIDADTHKILEVNKQALDLTHTKREDLINDSCQKWLCPSEKRDCPIADLDQKSSLSESKLYTKEGDELPVLKNAVHINRNGKNLLVETFIDLSSEKKAQTQQSELEDRLRQSQKMEAVGRLAGGIAHDFNNLLTSINGYSEMILSSISPEREELREPIEEIHSAGLQAASLTQHLLAFSKTQVSTRKIQSINSIVSDAVKMLDRIIGKDISLHLMLEENLRDAKVDANQIKQILLNLVVNARDFMPEGGSVTIRTTNDCPEDKEGNILLEVIDTGVGIDREIQKKIFEPFFTTKEQGKGTGLGLSTVFGIVEQNCGTTEVNSEPGKGATFQIRFPFATHQEDGDNQEEGNTT